jgi:hypothetical protein
MRTHAALLGLAIAFAASPAQAQFEPLKPIRAVAGGGLLIAQPVGEFDDFIDTGAGIGGNFILKLDRRGVLGLRADAGVIIYGHEPKTACISATVGCRVEVDINTSNNIAWFNVGPELTLPSGPLQPYVNGSVGVAYFATNSSLSGHRSGSEPFAETTNFDDATFAWQAGAGLRVPLRLASVPLYIDLGARYNTNGTAEFLREGDITDLPDGSIILDPQRSEANLLTFQIGVGVGIRW